MQNVQNADIQRVMNLVDLYRRKVGKESKIAEDAKDEKARWDDANFDAALHLHEEGFKGPIGIDMAPDMPEEWVNTLRVNDHLLGHFYSVVAGDDADKDVLSQFLADYYDSSVFTPEEEEFMRLHFKEMVNYIIQTPCDDLNNVNRHDGKDWQLIPTEVLELIKSRANIPAGSTIYNPFSGFAQMASVYSDCKFYCEDSYASYNKKWNEFSEKCHKESNIVLGTRDVSLMTAWMKVALYANSIDAKVIEDGTLLAEYDSVLSFIPRIPNAIPDEAYELDFELPGDPEIVNKMILAYKNLPEGGYMILVLPKDCLWASNSYYSLRPLWEEMINDKSLTEIIQLPWVMSSNIHREDYCVVIAEKGRVGDTTMVIDARFAVKKSEKKNFDQILDLSLFNELFSNNGIESTTGLRKVVRVPVEELKLDILVPQIYVIERPLEAECPTPLSALGTLATTRIRSLQIDLPEDTPWVELSDLSRSFKGDLNVTVLKKAECPNNPKFVEGSEDYAFGKSGKFIDDFWAQTYTKKGHRVYDYRRCTYLDGMKDALLFRLSEQGLGIAIVRATGKAVAVSEGIMVMYPENNINVKTLAVLLKLPIVIRQLKSFKDFGLAAHQDDILVPADKRIIVDEVNRMNNEYEVYKKQEELLATKKAEYINEVRMRKHDMGQYIFELVNIEDLMRYYVENRDKEQNFCQELETLLDNFRSSLGELSTLLDNLSKEELFGEPEIFNIDEFLSNLRNRHKADGFKIDYSRDESSIKKYYQKLHINESSILDDYALEDNTDYVDDYIPEDNTDYVDDCIPEDNTDYVDDYISEDNTDYVDDYIPEDNTDYVDDYIPEENTDYVDDYISEDNTDYVDDYISEDNPDNLYLAGGNTTLPKRIDSLPTLFVSSNDMQRLVSNIIDNARKHGFTDPSRKDYEVKVRLSIDAQKNMFQIDFCNNGTPLPEGMNKVRYGIKGEKAGKTAGTGIGGNYVKSFVDHYGGDYDIFMEDGWTVVRICLPIK